ncbi:Por secretion system C-terminal sorting domain-containing protein [Chryseobacterium sp. RU37D]|uniref:T9SS type A sorting domain-containing protein n=1 Tax=Chryseobacterium sp. RU37D TaxID=1907397 RepID=UPI0009574D5B|nr:T9SS type A sorting domain-containing protein [Chryseobacterium sp. RU37D]SIR02445.1 Por secretion system C-terminal sorting domain-containing protein [Chryseobacterium sp. RU37D]
MKKIILQSFVAMFVLLHSKSFGQVYQLGGNPINTTGWDIVPSAVPVNDFIQLTADQNTQVGGIKLNAPFNLNSCKQWKVEFDFRIDGNGTYAHGDGVAFWYLVNPPSSYATGYGLGIPDNAEGLMVAFDCYNNTNDTEMSKLHVLYGKNIGNIEFNNTQGSTFHSTNLQSSQPFVGSNYKHVEITGNVDPSNPNSILLKISMDGNVICNQAFIPSGGAGSMSQGYFGFSASTGSATARHSIKNVKVFIYKINLLQEQLNVNAAAGTTSIDLTSYNNQFVSNPSSYTFNYYAYNISTNAVTMIANPTNYLLTQNNSVILVEVKDPLGNMCSNIGQLLIQRASLGTNDSNIIPTNIFPNPTKGIINVSTARKIKALTVYDVTGRFLTKVCNSDKVDMSSYAKGVYYLQVDFMEGSSIREKIIKE